MAIVDDFIFTQRDFLSTSFAAFEDMRKRGHLCDLTIKVQNRSFLAHRVIVTAGIPCFDSVFDGLGTDDKEFAVGENLDPDALESLIDFAYTGKLTISSENVQSLLGVAQFLKLSQVQNACLAFMSKDLNSENIGKISTLACVLNNSEVIQSSVVYIQQNFEEFSKDEEFLSLPFDCLKEIISGDDLNVSNEEIVFERLIRWVKFSPGERQGMLPELLSETRLTFVSDEYLMETVESEELVMSLKGCRDLVKEVRYYHMMPEKVPTISNLKTYPRNCLKKEFYAFCICSTCGFSVHRYYSYKDKWHVLSSIELTNDPSTYIHWNNTVAVNGTMYRFSCSNGIQTFNIKTLEWDILRIKHLDYAGPTFVPFENKIYCFGNKKLVCLDTKQNAVIEIAHAPEIWLYAAAATLGNSIFITGGNSQVRKFNESRERWYNEIEGNSYKVAKYIPSTDKWTDVASMLIARSHHCCTSLNGKIYVCGNQGTDESRVEVYDPLTNQWNFLAPLDSKCTYVSLVSDHDKIFAFTENSAEIYEPRSRRWKSAKVPKFLIGVVSLPNEIAIDANEKAVEKAVEKTVEKEVEKAVE